MPRYNVQNPDTGLWACFSGISDEFITDWMPKDEYEEWRRKQYGEGVEPAEACNMLDYEEAMPIALFEQYEQGEIAPVVHAHWIDDGYYADFHPHKVYRCSNCDWSKLDVELPEEKYCPNCGAKMDEVAP